MAPARTPPDNKVNKEMGDGGGGGGLQGGGDNNKVLRQVPVALGDGVRDAPVEV